MSSHILALAASRWLQGSAARRSDPGAALAGGSKGAVPDGITWPHIHMAKQ